LAREAGLEHFFLLTQEKSEVNRAFAFLLGAQFCGALNDNLLRYFLSFSVATGGIWAGELGRGGQGWVGLAMALPFLMISGFAGQTADRKSKTTLAQALKKVEIYIAAVAAVGLLSGSLVLTFVAFFLLASQSAYFGPTKYGLIPELNQSQYLSLANGWINATTHLSAIIGMGLAGPLYALWANGGENWAPGGVLIALAYLGWRMANHIPYQKPQAPHLISSFGWFKPYKDAFSAMQAGPGFLIAGCWAGFYLLAGLALLFLPDWPALLGISQAAGSLLLAILGGSIGIGSALAGLLSGSNIRTNLIPLGATGMAIAFLALGLIPPTFTTTAGLLFLGGISSGFYVVPLQAALQYLAPEAERGRFLGAANMLSWTAIALASVLFLILRKYCDVAPHRIPLVTGLLAATGILLALPGPQTKMRQAVLST